MKRTALGLVLIVLALTAAAAAAQDSDLALPPAVESGMVPVNDIEMYYAAYGDPTSEPLILLHGGVGNADYFANQIPAFAEDYYVIAVDSRGHGRSTLSDQPFGYSLMASDVLALMDALDIEAANLLGWDDGGVIGLDIAIHHPERLIKLVTYGAYYNLSGVRTDVGESQRLTAYIETAIADRAALSPDPDSLHDFMDNIGSMWLTEPNYTADQLSSITVPTLILDGLQDEAITPEHTLDMAQRIPTADLVLMNGVGHFAVWEAPAAFNDIVLDYLAE